MQPQQHALNLFILSALEHNAMISDPALSCRATSIMVSCETARMAGSEGLCMLAAVGHHRRLLAPATPALAEAALDQVGLQHL